MKNDIIVNCYLCGVEVLRKKHTLRPKNYCSKCRPTAARYNSLVSYHRRNNNALEVTMEEYRDIESAKKTRYNYIMRPDNVSVILEQHLAPSENGEDSKISQWDPDRDGWIAVTPPFELPTVSTPTLDRLYTDWINGPHEQNYANNVSRVSTGTVSLRETPENLSACEPMPV